MPLYHDRAHCRSQRLLHPWHSFLLSEYLLAIKGESYSARRNTPHAIHQLSDDDLRDDAVCVWALVREQVARDIGRPFRERHADTAAGDDAAPNCSGALSLYGVLILALRESNFVEGGKLRVPAAAYLRARRDLEGAVGMRVAARRARLTLDQVFGPVLV